MRRLSWSALLGAVLLFCAPAFAVDGVVLINQATVMAAGGFPYKITQPGSYKLSGNLVVSGSTDAIDILSDHVAVDLNGFSIMGSAKCSGAGAAVSCVNTPSGNQTFGITALGYENTTIRNGTITGFGDGLFFDGSGLVEEMHLNHNYVDGMLAAYAVVRRNIALDNGRDGISAFNSTVTENVSIGNGRYGLFVVGGLFGSNTVMFNVSPLIDNDALSQKNNLCDAAAC